jgi:hypothetical protein
MNRDIAPQFFKSALDGVSGIMPLLLYPRGKSPTHCIRSFMDLRAGLDVFGINKNLLVMAGIELGSSSP